MELPRFSVNSSVVQMTPREYNEKIKNIQIFAILPPPIVQTTVHWVETWHIIVFPSGGKKWFRKYSLNDLKVKQHSSVCSY